MRQVVREIDSMAERLEDSGLNSQQSRAVIEAIANSIEKFSVTPERLSAELDRHGDSMKKHLDHGLDRVHDKFDLVSKKFDLVDQKFGVVHGRLDRLESLVKTMIGWQIASLTLFAGTLTGLVGVLAVRLL